MVLKLGYKASAEQFDARRLLDYAVLAEQCGFDSVFVSDHFQPWRRRPLVRSASFFLAASCSVSARASRSTRFPPPAHRGRR